MEGGGDANVVWDEAKGKAFRGAMDEAKMVCPGVCEREECPGVIGWGVIREGFEADHFRKGRNCGWGEL